MRSCLRNSWSMEFRVLPVSKTVSTRVGPTHTNALLLKPPGSLILDGRKRSIPAVRTGDFFHDILLDREQRRHFLRLQGCTIAST